MTKLNDPSIQWTKVDHEAYGWVVRFVSGEAGLDDIEALKKWSAQSPAHAAAFEQASRVWQATEPVTRKLSVANDSSPLRASKTLSAGVNGLSSRRPALSRRAALGGALAASVAGAAIVAAHPPLGLWPSWSEFMADYRTETGQTRQIALPGDVTIEMNTQTSIALRSAGDAKGGIELIAGEVMISAPPAASNPFTVLAADGQVIAADARFNLRCDGRRVCVTCVGGQVQVECGPARLLLSVGKQLTYSDHGLEQPRTINPAAVTAWQDGIVVFDATPVAEVIEEVNRYRTGRVILTNAALGRERFSARFRIANIDGVVDQIAQVFDVRARVLPGGIVLLG
jgi:transmembrane sensor